jgi:hypothetical protein
MPVSSAEVIQGNRFSETSWFDQVRPGWRLRDRHEADQAKERIVCGKVQYCGQRHREDGYECREIFYLNDDVLRWLCIEEWHNKLPAYSLWTMANLNGRIPPINATTLLARDVKSYYVAIGKTVLPHAFGAVNRSIYEKTSVRLILQWHEGVSSKPGLLPILCMGRQIDPIAEELVLSSTP